jgi:LYR motif-containing protein 4
VITTVIGERAKKVTIYLKLLNFPLFISLYRHPVWKILYLLQKSKLYASATKSKTPFLPPLVHHHQHSIHMATKEQVLLLYRHILRAAKHFPSIKKDGLISDIKTEFRDHKQLSDTKEIQHHMQVGIRSLEQLESYSGMDRKANDWAVYLKGSCD